MNEIIENITQKVKKELGLSGEILAPDLYDMLYEYRNSLHPDKFLDAENKSEAEEKFKHINVLLQELSRFIEQEKLAKKPSEIIPYKKEYEIITVKQSNLEYEERIKDLQNTITANEFTITDLKRELSRLRNEKADKKTQELIKLYKPSKRNLVSLSVTFVLTLVLGVLSKIDQITQLLIKYSPIKPIFLNSIIFGLLVLIPVIYVAMLYEENRIQYLAKRIKTPMFIKGFVLYTKENERPDTFTELMVFQYLISKLRPKNVIFRFLFSNIFHLYNDTTIDSLKDIFIYYLHNKQFIYISEPEGLDRTFKIWKPRHRYYPVNDDIEF